ncbi:5049_t:CDS:2 [Ambispora gerdemannii]|uniref:Peroxisomal membrane protein PEX14 n=1 Tax=Ambispora gerdemannii TaxID=144530 RepID=A0A9N8WGH6_9GLOM|nr:5049_t:CDS:2 [Ambispora gerdemannii]
MAGNKIIKDEEISSVVDLFEGEQSVAEDSDAEKNNVKKLETKQPTLQPQQKENKVQEKEGDEYDAVPQENRSKTAPTTTEKKVPSISKAPEGSPKTTTKEGSRTKIIESAATFLSIPSVERASTSKKIAFLKKKGLTEKEIELALERSQADKHNTSEDGSSPESTPPRLPPRTYKTPLTSTGTSIPTVYHPPLSNDLVQTSPPASKSKIDVFKKVIVALFVTGGISSALVHVIKNYILPTARAIMAAQGRLYAHQLELVRKLNENLRSFTFVDRISSANGQAITISSDGNYSLDTTSPKPLEFLAPIHTTILAIVHLLKTTHKRNAESRTISDAHAALTDLSSFLNTKLYDYHSWSISHERDSPVALCKSEIRSIKGSLISRRTFPKVPTSPSTTSNLGKQKTRVTPNKE